MFQDQIVPGKLYIHRDGTVSVCIELVRSYDGFSYARMSTGDKYSVWVGREFNGRRVALLPLRDTPQDVVESFAEENINLNKFT